MRKIEFIYSIFLIIFVLTSCSETYVPKPRAYFRINFPEREYQKYDRECNFSFDFPTYAEVVQVDERNSEPCWLNINYKPFEAKLYLSYKQLTDTNNMYELMEESRSLVYKHTIKAEEISENVIVTDTNVYGMFYELKGNTASAIQFFLTDSVDHYLRGALYFNVKSNRDSLEPVIDFLKVDIHKFIKTFEWR